MAVLTAASVAPLVGNVTVGVGTIELDLLEDARINPMEELEHSFEREQLHQLVDHAGLNDRELVVLEQRYGLNQQAPLQQLADRFGISRERTRQLEQNALRKLRRCAAA